MSKEPNKNSKQKEYANLLRDKNIMRWYRNVARGSKITADIYLRRLGSFCKNCKKTPQELIKLSEKNCYNLLLDVVSDMENKKLTGSYINSVLKAIKSWLAFNGKVVKQKIKIKGMNETPTLQNERIPTQDELKKIFLAGDEKSRVACALIAHSGLRIETLGNYEGTDGLKIDDFPEIEIKGDKIEFRKLPALIKVRSNLSKARREYFTFLSEEGCEYLKSYLETRLRKGEKLTQESAIIAPKTAKKEHISSINIGDTIRKAIRKAGFPWRPYVLRSYFDTQMMVAESKGLIIRDYRQFWMGHKGDIEHTYTLNKKKLHQDLIEEIRESYRKAQKYLQTSEIKGEDITKAFKKQLLLVAGFKAEEIKDEHLELKDEEFQKLVRGKLLKWMENNGAKQKIISTEEIENYLTQGWEFVANLPNNRAIIKLPDN